MFKKSKTRDIEALVRESCDLAQSMIADLRQSDPSNETFGQAGLLNGKDIVSEYLDHGELGCALSHVLYMVHESAISFPKEKAVELHEIAKTIGEPISYVIE